MSRRASSCWAGTATFRRPPRSCASPNSEPAGSVRHRAGDDHRTDLCPTAGAAIRVSGEANRLGGGSSLTWMRADLSCMISEQQREDLQQRIVTGVIDSDPVQMHGAVVAALELYPIPQARRYVFTPALRQLDGRPEHGRLLRAVSFSRSRAHRRRCPSRTGRPATLYRTAGAE